MRGRAVAITVLAITLQGCVAFLPDFRQDVYTQVSDVQVQLARLHTLIVTNDPAKVPYEKAEPFYINALADLHQAQAVAENVAAYHRGKLADLPARKSLEAIKTCRTAIELDRVRYKTDGMAPGQADNVEILMDTCLVSKQMQDLFKR